MKRLFIMLIILLVLLCGLQTMFNFLNNGVTGEYKILSDNIEFIINESSNYKENNYTFSIKADLNVFNFQTNYNFNKSSNVIKDIKYYKSDKYECILPIYKDDIIINDMMCINNDVIYYYHDIVSKDENLDAFISKINNYDINKFVDKEEYTTIEGLDIYKNNLISNHYIGLSNYKGIYDISSNFNSVVYNISLFKNDVYNQKLGVFVDKYYIVADYDKEYETNEFNLVDLVNLKTDKITTDTAITFDSFIQGVVDNKAYLYDLDRKLQYEINPNNKTIIKNSTIKYYNNGAWNTINANAAKDNKFIYNEINYQDSEYERIDRVGVEVGYYYLYKNNGHGYDVYSINLNDNSGLTYLFETGSIDNIFYIDNYVYYINDNTIKVYNRNFGVKNLIKYKELEFNKNIILNVYSK